MSSKTWSDSRRPLASRSTPTQHTADNNSQHQLIQDQLHVGDRVQVNSSLHGIVRFIGPTKFKAGTWAGIELDSVGLGKNDGSVDGKRYFVCPPKTGLFILAIKVIKQQQHLNLINRPSTPHHQNNKSKKSPPFTADSLPPLPPLPSHAPSKASNNELLSKIKALEQENIELKQAALLMEKKKNEHIEQLENTILQVKKASMDSIEILEDIHLQKIQQMTATLEDEKKKVHNLLIEQNDLRKAGLEAIESYETTLSNLESSTLKSKQSWDLERKKIKDEQDAMMKAHHQQVKLLLQDIDALEVVLQDKMAREIDLIDSLERERKNNSLLMTELKGVKFQMKNTNIIAGNDINNRWSFRDKLDTPIPEEEEEEDLFDDNIMSICALCEQKGHHLIHCHILTSQQQRQHII